MQGDAVAISAMGLGASRVALTMESWNDDLIKEAHRPRECFAHGYISGHQRDVFLRPFFAPGRG